MELMLFFTQHPKQGAPGWAFFIWESRYIKVGVCQRIQCLMALIKIINVW